MNFTLLLLFPFFSYSQVKYADTMLMYADQEFVDIYSQSNEKSSKVGSLQFGDGSHYFKKLCTEWCQLLKASDVDYLPYGWVEKKNLTVMQPVYYSFTEQTRIYLEKKESHKALDSALKANLLHETETNLKVIIQLMGELKDKRLNDFKTRLNRHGIPPVTAFSPGQCTDKVDRKKSQTWFKIVESQTTNPEQFVVNDILIRFANGKLEKIEEPRGDFMSLTFSHVCARGLAVLDVALGDHCGGSDYSLISLWDGKVLSKYDRRMWSDDLNFYYQIDEKKQIGEVFDCRFFADNKTCKKIWTSSVWHGRSWRDGKEVNECVGLFEDEDDSCQNYCGGISFTGPFEFTYYREKKKSEQCEIHLGKVSCGVLGTRK